MYINAIEAKRMVTEDKELNAKFRELIRGIAQLYAFQARTSEYSMSPERIVIRRETEVQVLTRLIGQVVRLNRESGCSFLAGFIRDFNDACRSQCFVRASYCRCIGNARASH